LALVGVFGPLRYSFIGVRLPPLKLLLAVIGGRGSLLKLPFGDLGSPLKLLELSGVLGSLLKLPFGDLGSPLKLLGLIGVLGSLLKLPLGDLGSVLSPR